MPEQNPVSCIISISKFVLSSILCSSISLLFSLKYFTAFIVTIPLIIYVDSFIFTRIFKSLENTNDERAREAEKEKAEKIETAKQHKAIDDNVDNTAVTLNDNQSDDSNN